MNKPAGAVATALFLASVGAGIAPAETILFSSDFSTDEVGSFFIDEEFSRPLPVVLAWDPTRGSPSPGSLRMEVSDQGQAIALGPCVAVDLAATYRIQADILAFANSVSPPSCIISFDFYTGHDCSGVAGQVPGASPRTGFEWEYVEFEAGPVLDDYFNSLRPKLVAGNPHHGLPASCNYDNLVISVVTPEAVPVTHWGGIALLAAAVALLGVLVMGRTWR